MKKLTMVLVVFFLIQSMHVFAGGDSRRGHASAEEKGYWGFSLGRAESDDYTDIGFSDDDSAFGLYGGININRNFAIEFGMVNLGEYEGVIQLQTYGISQYSEDIFGVYFAAVGKVRVSNKIDLIGKLGFMGWTADQYVVGVGEGELNETSAMFSLGATFKINRKTSVVADYTAYSEVGIAEVDINVFSLGLQFK